MLHINQGPFGVPYSRKNKMGKEFKPMLACDADLENLHMLPYPVAVFIKYDGVRTLQRNGNYGRSLKLHANPHLQELFNKPEYFGFDAEGIVGDPEAPDCISQTSGGFSRQKDKPKEGKVVKVDATLYVFDDFTNPDLTFHERYTLACFRVRTLLAADPSAPLRIAPMTIIHNVEDLLAMEDRALEEGHEGLIIRRLDGKYKFGRCTAKEGTYLRVKRFEEREGIIESCEEGFRNTNEKKRDPLGHAERSTAKDGMVPNGEIASFWVRDLVSNELVKVSAGKLTKQEALEGFQNFDTMFKGKISKYKVFAKGTGNFTKPRFPTHQCIRSKEDMS